MGDRDRLLVLDVPSREVGHGLLQRQRRAGFLGRPRVLDVEPTDRGAPKPREVGAAPELVAHVRRQDAHVRAAAADHEEVDVVVAAPRHLEGLHMDRPGIGPELLARPGGLVQLLATDLDGGVGGRALEQIARLPGHRRPNPVIVGLHGHRSDDVTVGVQGGGRDPQTERALVGLGLVAEEAQEPGGPADAHDQQAGRHRIEGARVSDLLRAQRPSHRRHRVVGRDPLRLVDQQEPVRAPGPRRGHGATGSPRSALDSRSIVSAGPCAEV